MKTILTATFATCCAVAVTLAPSAAQAVADPVATDVTFKPGYSYDTDTDMVTIKGWVASKAGKCEKGRKVILTATDTQTRAGVDRTNDEGFWKVTFRGEDVDPGDGNFRAVAPRVKVNGVTCARGRGNENIFGPTPTP
jgi:hypothetical protein